MRKTGKEMVLKNQNQMSETLLLQRFFVSTLYSFLQSRFEFRDASVFAIYKRKIGIDDKGEQDHTNYRVLRIRQTFFVTSRIRNPSPYPFSLKRKQIYIFAPDLLQRQSIFLRTPSVSRVLHDLTL